MAKAKSTAAVDTSAGTQAYALAVRYQAEIEPRLPVGTIANLVADLTARVEALADWMAAEALAKGTSGQGGSTGKERRAAEARILDAVARISGAGVLAFATHAAVRAEFEALKGMKSG